MIGIDHRQIAGTPSAPDCERSVLEGPGFQEKLDPVSDAAVNASETVVNLRGTVVNLPRTVVDPLGIFVSPLRIANGRKSK